MLRRNSASSHVTEQRIPQLVFHVVLKLSADDHLVRKDAQATCAGAEDEDADSHHKPIPKVGCREQRWLAAIAPIVPCPWNSNQ